MAEVWRAVHAAEEVPVAIKVLTTAHAREDAFVRALRNEIHAAARLHHPAIILLFDRGEVDRDAAASSEGRLVAGSPWFAMELASHGALSPRRFPLPFSTTKTLLLSLLDALAHAHARGVIHRDLKPGNILLCAPDDARPGLKLSDFGIARPAADAPVRDIEGALSGTPRYMAPEQFTGRFRELGPSTDLYALGCIAYQLASGKTPFVGDNVRLAMAHCHEAVPALQTHAPGYPPGFEPWVMRLLQKRPEQRFASAADAAWGLLRLSDGAEGDGWEDAFRTLKPRPASSGGAGAPSDVDATAPRTLDGRARSSASGISGGTDGSADGASAVTGQPLRPPDASMLLRSDIPTAKERRLQRSSGSMPVATSEPGAEDGIALSNDDPLYMALWAEARRTDPELPVSGVSARSAPQPWTELAALQAMKTNPGLLVRSRIDDSAVANSANGDVEPKTPLAERLAPPMPRTWRRVAETVVGAEPTRTRHHLLGAGLGLYGVRQVSFVDRRSERDQLWRALERAHAGGSAVVVVHGPVGIGKSRLCEWLTERAAEVGAATILRGSHGPARAALDGVPGMLLRHARAVGLSGDALLERLAVVFAGLDRDDLLAVRALVAPSEESGRTASQEEPVRLHSPQERYTVALRALARVARGRPVIGWVDDVQWGDDSLSFARFLLESRSDARGLVLLLSASDEALAERPLESAIMERLRTDPAVETIAVPPLPADDHRLLVEQLLGLEPRLAELVASRTAGNPSFAVQLVGDFVQRGALESTATGFALRRGEQAILPDDLHAVWSRHLRRMLEPLPPDAQLCLELGSVLGAESDERDWEMLCRAAGIRDPRAVIAIVIDALEQARFAVLEEGSIRFVHAMLRESMGRLAAEAGRLDAHHRLAARVLLARQPGRRSLIIERVARHQLLAGDLAEAVPSLLEAARVQSRRHGSARAQALVDEAFAAIDRLALPERDPSRVEACALRAHLLVEEGRYAEASMWAGLVLAGPSPWSARSDALRCRATIALRKGSFAAALERYEELRTAAAEFGDEPAGIQARLGIADAHYYRGHLALAGDTLAEALDRSRARDDDAAVALCLWSSAYVALWRGELDQARALLLRQQKLARKVGDRGLVAYGRNALGDVERLAGRPDDARTRYDEALRMLSAIGSGTRRVVQLNLALTHLATGDVAGAGESASLLLPEVERAGERVLISLGHGILAVRAAADNDWSACDAHLAALSAPQTETGIYSGEHALLYEAIAVRAAGKKPWRAGLALSLAEDVWRTLQRSDGLARVARQRATLAADEEGNVAPPTGPSRT